MTAKTRLRTQTAPFAEGRFFYAEHPKHADVPNVDSGGTMTLVYSYRLVECKTLPWQRDRKRPRRDEAVHAEEFLSD
ncbi:MAG: hypothetical protein VX520_02300 [Planctomycetota bacterium]|nr:hypothetical protein [Planctomycetota bacterium]